MPTIIDLRPEIEKISGRIAIVALLILCLCIKVYTTQFWHDMNVDHRVKWIIATMWDTEATDSIFDKYR